MSKERNNKKLKEIRKRLFQDPVVRSSVEKTDLEYQIYNAFRDFLSKTHMTQSDLAKAMGTCQSAISRYERGNSNPTLWFIQRMAEALGLKISLKFEPRQSID